MERETEKWSSLEIVFVYTLADDSSNHLTRGKDMFSHKTAAAKKTTADTFSKMKSCNKPQSGLHFDASHIHYNTRKPAQLREGNIRSDDVAQLKMSITDAELNKSTQFPSYYFAENVKFNDASTHALTGASSGGRVCTTSEHNATAAVDLNNMDTWRSYTASDDESYNLLQEVDTGKTLTRMHVINGKLHKGDSEEPANMVLGKQKDNHNHLDNVETVVKNWVNRGNRAVYYRAVPQYGGFPNSLNYVLNEMNNAANWSTAGSGWSAQPGLSRTDYENWVTDTCPQQLNCSAIFYRKNGDNGWDCSDEKNEVIPLNQ